MTEKKVSYSGVHKWLSRNFTKLEECEHCGSDRFIEWALKTGMEHLQIRDNYICLCSSCHKKYDYTDERKVKLSKSLKLVPHTKEWNKKVGESNKGKVVSQAHRKILSEARKKNPKERDSLGRFIKDNYDATYDR
jgi:hypothetical protein